MNFKQRCVLGIFLLAAGMSASVFSATAKPQPPKAGEERPDDVICVFETPMGSHIKRQVCATRQARDEARKTSQEDMNRLRRGSGKPDSKAEPSL